MKLENIYRNKDPIVKQQKLFEVFSLLSAIIAPVFVVIWIKLNSDLSVHLRIVMWILAFYFLSMYCSIYISSYVRKRLSYFLYGGYYLVSAFAIYLSYLNSFMEGYGLLVMLIIFYISLTFNEIKVLTFYVITIFILLGSAVYLLTINGNVYYKNGIIIVICLLVFFAMAYLNLFLRKRFQEEFLSSQKDYHRLLEVSPYGLFVHEKGNILYANKAVAEIANTESPENLIGKSIFDFIRQEDYTSTKADIEAILKGEIKGYREEKLILANNISRDIEFVNIVTKYMGKTAILTIIRDISQRKKMQQQLIEAENKYRNIVEGALIGVFIYQDDKFAYVNKCMEDIFGYTTGELYQTSFLTLAAEEDQPHVLELRQRLLTGTKEDMLKLKGVKKDGSIIHIQLHAKAMLYQGLPAIMGMLIDITDQTYAEEKIKQMALYDSLTGLPNRYFLNYRLKGAIDASTNMGFTFGLMFIDLDGFKIINDTMGHSFGDEVLKQAALEIGKCLHEDDFVSRYGGDEFVVMVENTSKEKVKEKVHNIIRRFTSPISVSEHEIFVTPSIGVCLSPQDSSDGETLIKYADTAMYQAKSLGKNNYVFYKPELNNALTRRVEMEKGLRRALKRGEFILYYQPQLDLNSGRIYGTEALIRWKHPKLGFISPGEFIPLTEETGLIIPIGEWVLKTACKQSKAWQEAGLPFVNVAVNISNKQIINSNFANIVNEALRESGLEPQYLELEITESILKNIEELNHVLEEIKAIGVKISMDDFGVGYSSLSILQHVSINNLKIDQSFITNVLDNPKAAAIVKTIIAMGENLNCAVTAEGVETEEQLRFLKQNSCEVAQGYLFSRPLPAEEFEKFLRNHIN
jgi:diguanylate cyclase (GGDEF)-like protein/PAS domain S-box-containing protein